MGACMCVCTAVLFLLLEIRVKLMLLAGQYEGQTKQKEVPDGTMMFCSKSSFAKGIMS